MTVANGMKDDKWQDLLVQRAKICEEGVNQAITATYGKFFDLMTGQNTDCSPEAERIEENYARFMGELVAEGEQSVPRLAHHRSEPVK